LPQENYDDQPLFPVKKGRPGRARPNTALEK